VWELLVEDDDVGETHALEREMTVRIEFDTNDALGPDDGAYALDDIAFDVVVTERHHGAMQAEQYAVERQRSSYLGEDLVTHGLIVSAVGGPGRAG
jgi:hypothetical protein